MDIRIGFSAVFTLVVIALIYCALKCLRSHRAIGKAVGMLDLALIPPLIGNLMIIGTSIKPLAIIGYYIYLLGMNVGMLFLVNFTDRYCQGIGNGQQKPTVVYVALALDTVQMFLNPFFGHAFSVEPVDVQGKDYYRLVPHFGQIIHRIVDYGVFVAVLLIFILASVKTAKLYRERFLVVLAAMLLIGLWQTFYIFSRTPVDRSMIGYGIFGLLITYFSIYYRPLRLLDNMLSNIASNITDGLLVFDQLGKCIWANKRAFEILDVEESDLDSIPDALTKLFGKRDFKTSDWSYSAVIGTGENARYFTIENRSINDHSRKVAGAYLNIRDNTEQQRRVRQELYTSTHDILTGLYTKQYFFECVRKTLVQNPNIQYTAIFVDVKNFKIVNDIFSTAFGDKALQHIAEWIKNDMTEKCVYGRLAGDTFGVFIPKDEFAVQREHVEKDLESFIVTDGKAEHQLLIHLGIYDVKNTSLDVSVMFDRAHLALSQIKGDYKNHIAYYDDTLREIVLWDQRITAELHDALKENQIRPFLQPITDNSGKVIGAEALARWIHPELGFLPPYKFIPVFERNGMIVEVDRHMWRSACEYLSQWKTDRPDLFISVNISPKDFYFIDVAAEIKSLVAEYGIDPSKLRIEITETVMMNDSEEKFTILKTLRKAGFIVEMDDFGSGYSSLNLLKNMPVDVLKIDMKFLAGTGEDEQRAQTIIKNIIRLSDELGIASLTEGVETEQQFSELAHMGCVMFQGYYFAKPMPVEEFIAFADR